MARNKLILIGPINTGHIACTGDTVKNQLFLKRFLEVFDKVIIVDTYHWQKRPWCLVNMVIKLIIFPHAKVVVSANPKSADIIIRFINILGMSSRTFYWVVGGLLHSTLENNILNWKTYKNLAGIFVQGLTMVKSMKDLGLHNVKYVPNSKYINYIPVKPEKRDCKTHFVFLSRIEKYKGCDYILDCINILNNKGYKGKYDITFYGKTTDEKEYFAEFKQRILNNEDAKYEGVLNLQDTKQYDKLSEFDVMLFPTYWPGEGFPGVIIDAYIAGLPVIASDWNLNKDVIEDGITGWIVPTHDVDALANKMIYVIDNKEIVAKLSKNSKEKAMNYDSRNVLSNKNLNNLGLI